MMISVTIVGVATTLAKELLALGPSFLMTIPNLFKGMEEAERIANRRDVNKSLKTLKPELKEEVHKILADVRPKLLELLEPLESANEEFKVGLGAAVKEWSKENKRIEAEDFPALEMELSQLKPSKLMKRAVDSGVVDKKEAVRLTSTEEGERALQSLIQQQEFRIKRFPRQRVFKRAFIAMEPTVRALAADVDTELGKQHLKLIDKIPTPEKSMDVTDVQRDVELLAEEAVLGQAKSKVWPEIEEKLSQIPVRATILHFQSCTHRVEKLMMTHSRVVLLLLLRFLLLLPLPLPLP